MPNHYELIVILAADLSSEDVQAATAQITGVIDKNSGDIMRQEDWGVRNLAYELKKQKKGRYLFAYFTADGIVVPALERALNVMESALKYMVVRLGKAQIESHRKKAADEQAKEKAKAAEAAAAAAAEAAEPEPAEPEAAETAKTATSGNPPEENTASA